MRIPSYAPSGSFRSRLHLNQSFVAAFTVLGAFILLVLVSSSALAQGGNAPAANIARMTVKSSVLGEDRAILVRTPVGYEQNNQSYPVLYLTDGDAHLGHTSSTIEFLARNGRMAETIVVAIPNTDRTRDLSPTRPETKGATGAPQFPTAGGADNFLKFIETELIPEIDKRYRVRPYRTLAGHSLGGLFAIHALLTRPEVFNSYVAVSPALQWDNQVAVKRAEDFFKTRKELNATLFVSLGDEPGGIEDGFHQFKQILAKNQVKGFDWDAQQWSDEDHGSVVMRSHYFGLRKIYDGWQMPRDRDMGTIAGGLKGADEHYRKLSEKFRYEIQVPEAMVNILGYQALGGGRTDEAIAIFKRNVERYPESANVYDSLAEAYETTGKLELAAPLYEKASTLGQKNNDPNAALFTANFTRASDKLKQAAAKPGEPVKKSQ
ncbi:MAG TPA: alpha/beta hydrolase-fold protein [Pyrinomonadaceae bacterium]|nr:alpha/beta hydrolase-fold protein [Pyrinomonadaceae bacterium]